MAPLRRKPKQLDEAPTAFSLGNGGAVLLATGGGRDRGRARGRAGGTSGETDEQGRAVPLADVAETVTDHDARQRALRIARRLAVTRPRRDVRPQRGAGELVSTRWRGASDDIDLDATIAVLAENPAPDDEDIIVRERIRRRRSVALVVDVSGSMRGERVRTAAATVGALASELARERLAVVAFWSDAVVLSGLDETVAPNAVLDLLLRLPARGLTNVGFGLELAGRQLQGVPASAARILLLSDCVHNAGPDPRAIAARLPRVDVLLDTSGEHDLDLGRDLAHAGRGRIRTVHDYRHVAPALNAIFA